jgi:diguanylate cyclase (GGDEF)-like protein
MFRNNRKTIGVFATQINQEFQKVLIRGISKKAKELGYNVAFFTNFLGYGEIQYEVGERSIADLPVYQDLDGIVILPDTMYVEGFEQRILENIKKNSKCPVVSVRRKTDGFYNVLIKDDCVLDEIIRHFIVDHGYRRINFLTGPKSNQVAVDRLEAYRKILTEYNIPFEEERTYYGDFWKFMAKDAVNQWLSDPEKRPEAIICGNDYMAITVCNELAERGISVPEDIAVSGCDNIEITKDFNPSITTAGIPMYEMGMEAVNKIYLHNEGIMQDMNSYMNTVTMIRESCGCANKENRRDTLIRRNRVIREMERKENAISNNAFMSVELTNIKTVEELDQKLVSLTNMNENLSGFYMCLHKNWDLFGAGKMNAYSEIDEMTMEVGIRNGQSLKKVGFSKSELLPPVHDDLNPQIFFFNVLHYREIIFGYTAISFSGEEIYDPSYHGWIINVCNALENIRIHNELNRLVYRLEDMYIKDELTDLYNRRALELLGQKYLRQCVEEQSKLMLFTADMDKLKYINDNYGHANGDIAIRAVADALKYAAEDDEICMRVGGDEFVVIGMEYDDDKMEKFLKKFEGKLDRFNKEENHEYIVNVSYGWSIIKPNKLISIEDCLILADSKMYQLKYEKKARKLKYVSELMEQEEN